METLFKKRYETRKKEYSDFREVIAVFSSVSNEAPMKFQKTCVELGKALSENQYKISYGGSRNGCSRWILNGAVRTGNADVRAVKYTDWPVNERMEHPPKGLRTEIVQTGGPDLFMRMAELKRDAMACVVLPGGPATLEEMWNAIGGVAEFGPLPVIILNLDGFYDSAKKQMEVMADYFYWPKYNKYVLFAKDVDEVVQLLNTMRYLKTIQKGKMPYKSNAIRMRRSQRLQKRHHKKRSTRRKA